MHITVDGLDNPLRFILTGDQENDIAQAEALRSRYTGEYVIADKGYDAQWLREWIAELGMTAVMLGRSNWKVVILHDPGPVRGASFGGALYWQGEVLLSGECSPGLRSCAGATWGFGILRRPSSSYAEISTRTRVTATAPSERYCASCRNA